MLGERQGSEMHRDKLVSILIPCYNHEKFVGNCLDSILSQTYEDYEVVICDDASRDRSVSVILEYQKKFEDRNIRLILLRNEENRGITVGLNRMLGEARGEYVKIIASDDMLSPDYLRVMAGRLAEEPSLQCVFCNCIKVGESAGYPVGENEEEGLLLDAIPDCGQPVFEQVYLHNFVPAPSTMFRRHVLAELGGYDEEIGIEDLEMLLRVLRKYPRGLKGYEEALVYYRLNSNSISSIKKNRGAKKRIKFMFGESAAIARKYKGDVSLQAYRKRMRDLRLAYLIQRVNLVLNRS